MFPSLKLEYNSLDYMIFTVNIDELDSAVIFLEDLRRPGDLKRDFSFLIPTYYSENDILDDTRNLISIKIFPMYDRKRSNENKETIEALALNLIEHRNLMNIKYEWKDDSQITKYYSDDDVINFIEQILSHSENSSVYTIDNNSLNHLNQTTF